MEVVGEARDGLEAVELARETRPEVCIFDMKMPNLDGVEAARRVYAESPVPIVMLTAFSDERSVEQALGAGVFAYLSKPFTSRDVIPAIRAAVARHEDLLAARREVGKRDDPLEVTIRSSTGLDIPLRVRRRPDGTVDVDLAP